MGSPPRVRGTDLYQALQNDRTGITPACAGNRSFDGAQICLFKDHPRVCGEQGYKNLDQLQNMGSPPRVRGTVIGDEMNGWYYRITPACAGNSCQHFLILILVKDHPRVCGEQNIGLTRMVVYIGSPPRVRGTVNRVRNIKLTKRIPPACAGNSIYIPTNSAKVKDHPRVCGEQLQHYQYQRPI